MDWQILGSLGSFLQGVTSVITLVTVAVSLIYIFRQTREMTNQSALSASTAIASAYYNIATTMIEVNRFFADNRELKPYFFENATIKENHPKYEKVISIAEMLLDYWDLIRVLELATPPRIKQPWKGGTVYSLPWKEWQAYFIEQYTSSPAIRRFWAKNREFYLPTLGDILDSLPNEFKNKTDDSKGERRKKAR